MATQDIEDRVPIKDPNNNKEVQEIFPYPGTNVKSLIWKYLGFIKRMREQQQEVTSTCHMQVVSEKIRQQR